jgi:hypothetical protein
MKLAVSEMKAILSFFAILSGVGLVLSMASHAAALFGAQGPLGDFAFVLHIGIFVVWIPAILAAHRLVQNARWKDFWKAALRGCPGWMTYMTYGLAGYAVFNFAVFAMATPTTGQAGPMSPEVVRGFSGHWMAFYSAALAILYSAANMWDQSRERHCPNGHEVQPLARFCDQCGQPVGSLPRRTL